MGLMPFFSDTVERCWSPGYFNLYFRLKWVFHLRAQ